MRIVGGKFKGRNLVAFKGEEVRPTSDQARESLFNILQFKIVDKSFLDVFAGTGAVGIEAISRGAKKALLNDYSKDSLAIIKKNLSLIGAQDQISISNRNALDLLSMPPEKFDIIFMDPPYKSEITKKAISLSINALADDGIVILESEDEITEQPDGLIIFDRRKYGRARFTFFKRS